MQYSDELYPFVVSETCSKCKKKGNYDIFVKFGVIEEPAFECHYCGTRVLFSMDTINSVLRLYEKHDRLMMLRRNRIDSMIDKSENSQHLIKEAGISWPLFISLVFAFFFMSRIFVGVEKISVLEVGLVIWMMVIVFLGFRLTKGTVKKVDDKSSEKQE